MPWNVKILLWCLFVVTSIYAKSVTQSRGKRSPRGYSSRYTKLGCNRRDVEIMCPDSFFQGPEDSSYPMIFLEKVHYRNMSTPNTFICSDEYHHCNVDHTRHDEVFHCMAQTNCAINNDPQEIAPCNTNTEMVFVQYLCYKGSDKNVIYMEEGEESDTDSDLLVGHLLSPNYPYKHDSYIDVECYLETTHDAMIFLEMLTFNLEYANNCKYDHLEVQSTSSKSTYYEKFCGGHSNTEIRTESDSLRVRFISDVAIEDRGFWMLYYAVRNDDSAILEPVHVHCSANSAYGSSSGSGDMDMSGSGDGPHEEDPPLFACTHEDRANEADEITLSCPQYNPEKRNMIYIHEATYGTYHPECSSATYGTNCESSGMQNDYVTRCQSREYCQIPAVKQQLSGCNDAKSSYLEVHFYCVEARPDLIQDFANPSYVQMMSGPHSQGAIMTPNYPEGPYGPNLNCQCKVETDTNGFIFLHVLERDIQGNDDCDTDGLHFTYYANPGSNEATRIQRCDTAGYEGFDIHSNRVIIGFVSNQIDHGRGFWLKYQAYDKDSGIEIPSYIQCERLMDTNDGSIHSDPSTNLICTNHESDNNLKIDCTPVNSNEISMIFIDNAHFGTKHSECDYDGKKKRSASQDCIAYARQDREITRCQSRGSCEISSQSRSINHCDSDSTYLMTEHVCLRGTQETFRDICQYYDSSWNQEHDHGYIHSPNYPNNYNSNKICQCTITTRDEGHIEMRILDMDIQNSSYCEDSLSFSHKASNARVGNFRCGFHENSPDFIFETSSLEVKFIANLSKQRRGFWLIYQGFHSQTKEVLVSYIKCRQPQPLESSSTTVSTGSPSTSTTVSTGPPSMSTTKSTGSSSTSTTKSTPSSTGSTVSKSTTRSTVSTPKTTIYTTKSTSTTKSTISTTRSTKSTNPSAIPITDPPNSRIETTPYLATSKGSPQSPSSTTSTRQPTDQSNDSGMMGQNVGEDEAGSGGIGLYAGAAAGALVVIVAIVIGVVICKRRSGPPSASSLPPPPLPNNEQLKKSPVDLNPYYMPKSGGADQGQNVYTSLQNGSSPPLPPYHNNKAMDGGDAGYYITPTDATEEVYDEIPDGPDEVYEMIPADHESNPGFSASNPAYDRGYIR